MFNESYTVPIKEMAAVTNVKTTEYTSGAVETVDEYGFPKFIPLHICIMKTRDGHTHAFVWEY